MEFILKPVLGLATASFSWVYFSDLFRNRGSFSGKSGPGLTAIGFITNFFDTLGIGSFAQQTALFKFFKLVDDRLIPATMNAGNTTNTVIQAFIFMSSVKVDPLTLISMSVAAPLGAVLGAGVVVRMPRRRIQLGMGIGLLVVALTILAGLLGLMPLGGEAIGLSGGKLIFITAMSFIFGALQTIGIGFYAPCMALVYSLGMHPLTAFPIMMTATAMLMLAGSARFINAGAYDRKAALAQTIGGAAGVILAAFVVKSLPLMVMKWVVCAVVLYTSAWMFASAAQKEPDARLTLTA